MKSAVTSSLDLFDKDTSHRKEQSKAVLPDGDSNSNVDADDVQDELLKEFISCLIASPNIIYNKDILIKYISELHKNDSVYSEFISEVYDESLKIYNQMLKTSPKLLEHISNDQYDEDVASISNNKFIAKNVSDAPSTIKDICTMCKRILDTRKSDEERSSLINSIAETMYNDTSKQSLDNKIKSFMDEHSDDIVLNNISYNDIRNALNSISEAEKEAKRKEQEEANRKALEAKKAELAAAEDKKKQELTNDESLPSTVDDKVESENVTSIGNEPLEDDKDTSSGTEVISEIHREAADVKPIRDAKDDELASNEEIHTQELHNAEETLGTEEFDAGSNDSDADMDTDDFNEVDKLTVKLLALFLVNPDVIGNDTEINVFVSKINTSGISEKGIERAVSDADELYADIKNIADENNFVKNKLSTKNFDDTDSNNKVIGDILDNDEIQQFYLDDKFFIDVFNESERLVEAKLEKESTKQDTDKSSSVNPIVQNIEKKSETKDIRKGSEPSVAVVKEGDKTNDTRKVGGDDKASTDKINDKVDIPKPTEKSNAQSKDIKNGKTPNTTDGAPYGEPIVDETIIASEPKANKDDLESYGDTTRTRIEPVAPAANEPNTITFDGVVEEGGKVRTVLDIVFGIPADSKEYDRQYPYDMKSEFENLDKLVSTIGANRTAYRILHDYYEYLVKNKVVPKANMNSAIEFVSCIEPGQLVELASMCDNSNIPHLENFIKTGIGRAFMHTYIKSMNGEICDKLFGDSYEHPAGTEDDGASSDVSMSKYFCDIAESLYGRYQYDFMKSSVIDECKDAYVKLSTILPNDFSSKKVNSHLIYKDMEKLISGKYIDPSSDGSYSEDMDDDDVELMDEIKSTLEKMKEPYNEYVIKNIFDLCKKNHVRAMDTHYIEVIGNMVLHGKNQKEMKDTLTRVNDGRMPTMNAKVSSQYKVSSKSLDLEKAYNEVLGFPCINLKSTAFTQIAYKNNPKALGARIAKSIGSKVLKGLTGINISEKEKKYKDRYIENANATEKEVKKLLKHGTLMKSWFHGNKEKPTAVKCNGRGIIDKISDFGLRSISPVSNNFTLKQVMNLVKEVKSSGNGNGKDDKVKGSVVPVSRRMLKVSIDDEHKYNTNALIANDENNKFSYVTVADADKSKNMVALARNYIDMFYSILDPRDATTYASHGIPSTLKSKSASDVTNEDKLVYINDVNEHDGYPETYLLTGNESMSEENYLVKSGINFTTDLVAIRSKTSRYDLLFIIPKSIAKTLFYFG